MKEMIEYKASVTISCKIKIKNRYLSETMKKFLIIQIIYSAVHIIGKMFILKKNLTKRR